LAAARTERARVSRSSLQLQSQMKQLRKQLSRTGESGPVDDGQEAASLPSGGAVRKGRKAMQVPVPRSQPSEFLESPQMAATPTVAIPAPVNREPSSGGEQQSTPPKYISVKRGDTLWSIGQKYRVNVEHLRRLNQLTDNRIVIGQALWLSNDRAMEGVGADKGASTP